MISIIFSGKIVMSMHIVTMEFKEIEDGSGVYQISLSNGLVLEEAYANSEQKLEIAKRLAFVEK